MSAENPLIAATEAIYEASEKTIDRLVSQTEFAGKQIFVVGAIIINSDYKHNSFLELRRFNCLDAKTKQILAQHL